MSGIVVVKVAVDGCVAFEIRHSLVDIDNRVEYDCVSFTDDVECEDREINSVIDLSLANEEFFEH